MGACNRVFYSYSCVITYTHAVKSHDIHSYLQVQHSKPLARVYWFTIHCKPKLCTVILFYHMHWLQ